MKKSFCAVFALLSFLCLCDVFAQEDFYKGERLVVGVDSSYESGSGWETMNPEISKRFQAVFGRIITKFSKMTAVRKNKSETSKDFAARCDYAVFGTFGTEKSSNSMIFDYQILKSGFNLLEKSRISVDVFQMSYNSTFAESAAAIIAEKIFEAAGIQLSPVEQKALALINLLPESSVANESSKSSDENKSSESSKTAAAKKKSEDSKSIMERKPTDKKYFTYGLNKFNHISIYGLKTVDLINDDEYENILVPATIEGIPVDYADISIKFDLRGADYKKITNELVKQKALDNGIFICERLGFEEGIKQVDLEPPKCSYIEFVDDESGRTSYAEFGKFMFDNETDLPEKEIKNIKEKIEYAKNHKIIGLKELVFPKGCKASGVHSGGDLDLDCGAMEHLVFPEDLAEINFTLSYVTDLAKIQWPKCDFKIHTNLFYGWIVEEFVIPEQLKEIGSYSDGWGAYEVTCFFLCKIKKIIFSKNINITGLFSDMTLISEIEIPDNAVIIFRNFLNPSYPLSAPDGVKKVTIGENAVVDPLTFSFSKPKTLTEFILPESAKINFGKYPGYNYFAGCTNLPISTQLMLKKAGYKGGF